MNFEVLSRIDAWLTEKQVGNFAALIRGSKSQKRSKFEFTRQGASKGGYKKPEKLSALTKIAN